MRPLETRQDADAGMGIGKAGFGRADQQIAGQRQLKTAGDGNTIDRAKAVTEGVRPNGGLLVDTWHVARGGMNFDEIAKLPLELIKSIELDDASHAIVESLLNDSTHHRKLCGEGDLDVPAFIQQVVNVGYRGPWGVELISAQLRKLPLDVAAKRAFDTTMAQFENIQFPA